MYQGIIVSYYEKKRFGFIASGALEIFYHITNFQRGFRPVVGHSVVFDIAPGFNGKREQAINVRPINVEPETAAEFIAGVTDAMKDAGGAQ